MVGPLLEVEMSKKCTPLWREAHFQVKMYKTPQLRTTFGSCDVEKVHAVVARSTFPSQNVQNTAAPDHFWRLRCRKSARRCGAKHISKSKVLKTDGLGPLLEVQMSKKCRKSARRNYNYNNYNYNYYTTTTTTQQLQLQLLQQQQQLQLQQLQLQLQNNYSYNYMTATTLH